MNKCYECKYRGVVPGSCHSTCRHPLVLGNEYPILMALMAGVREIGEPFNLQFDEHGFKNGWFNWPTDFDPTWLKNCDSFEKNNDNLI